MRCFTVSQWSDLHNSVVLADRIHWTRGQTTGASLSDPPGGREVVERRDVSESSIVVIVTVHDIRDEAIKRHIFVERSAKQLDCM